MRRQHLVDGLHRWCPRQTTAPAFLLSNSVCGDPVSKGLVRETPAARHVRRERSFWVKAHDDQAIGTLPMASSPFFQQSHVEQAAAFQTECDPRCRLVADAEIALTLVQSAAAGLEASHQQVFY
jgi:hypothetical protein